MEENKEKSLFLTAVCDFIDNASDLRQSNDCMLAIISDGKVGSHYIGGDVDIIEACLLNLMRQKPGVARMIVDAALTYHLEIAPILKVQTPPLPKDGIAEWPGIIDGDKAEGVASSSTSCM